MNPECATPDIILDTAAVLDCAADLLSDDGENPPYDNAILDLVTAFLGTHSAERAWVERQLRTGNFDLVARKTLGESLSANTLLEHAADYRVASDSMEYNRALTELVSRALGLDPDDHTWVKVNLQLRYFHLLIAESQRRARVAAGDAPISADQERQAKVRIVRAMNQMPYSGSPELITLARKAQNDLTWETVAAYLDELAKVLADVGKINNDRESELTRLKNDLDAVRRVFGWED